MSNRHCSSLTTGIWIGLLSAGFFLCPMVGSGGEFAPDANTLFLAHYNTSLDADYSQGPAAHDPLDTAYLTKNGGGYFGEGLAARVGEKALQEAGADIKGAALIPKKAFDGVRYASPGNLDLTKGTFECWYKPFFSIQRAAGMSKDWPMIYSLFGYTQTAGSYLFLGLNHSGQAGQPGANIAFLVTKGERGTVCINYGVDWKPGIWHHLAVTWDTTAGPGRIALLVDGRLVQSQPLTPLQGGFLKPTAEFPYFCVGAPLWRRSGNEFQFFKADGIIDEVRISNSVRYTQDFKLPEKPK